jgi:hypothetical protein
MKTPPFASDNDSTATTLSSDAVLDAVLATQFLVAWAGEKRSKPPRLGWWDTDLIDEYGGGDVLARLAPRTHAWASLEATREATRRVDARARGKHGQPDQMRSIFFLGFELDERLADRLTALKRALRPPDQALHLALPLASDFRRDDVLLALSGGLQPSFETVPPIGRRLKGTAPASPDELVRVLAAALVPPADEYPLPFYKLET